MPLHSKIDLIKQTQKQHQQNNHENNEFNLILHLCYVFIKCTNSSIIFSFQKEIITFKLAISCS